MKNQTITIINPTLDGMLLTLESLKADGFPGDTEVSTHSYPHLQVRASEDYQPSGETSHPHIAIVGMD